MSVRSLCTGLVAAVTLTLAFCAPALAAPEPFRFLPGAEGFDGSLPAGPPLSLRGSSPSPSSTPKIPARRRPERARTPTR